MEILIDQGTTDASGTVLRQTRTGCEWWTYAGLKANAALVQRHGLSATFDSLTIRAHCSPIELNLALESPSNAPSPEIDQHFLPKFAECLPDGLLVQFAGERLYDVDSAIRTERSRIMQII